MVGPVQDMKETQIYKPQGGLVPPWIEPDQARIAQELESTVDATRRQKLKGGHHPQGEVLDGGVDRKIRMVGLNRVLEPHVEQHLLPVYICIRRELRAHEVRLRLLIRDEGLVGGQ